VDREHLVTQLGLNHYVIHKNVEGLSHADTLIQPQPAGNCMNWVLGHIVRTRNEAIEILGPKPLLPPEKFATYTTSPIREGARAVRFEELLRDYDALQQPWAEALRAVTPAAWAKPAPFSPTGNKNESLGSLVATLVFHESYHAGQIGLLRRLVGKPGVIQPPQRRAPA
jgi:uncharacterized damage-inducible protein DinB